MAAVAVTPTPCGAQTSARGSFCHTRVGMYVEERDGKWRAAVRWAGERRRTSWQPSKQAARSAGAALQAVMATEASQRPVSGTVGDLIDTWMRERSRRWSPTTLADYRRLVARLHATDARWQDLPVAAVDARWVARWHRQLDDAGWSPHRVVKVHAVLSAAWAHAVADDRAPSNPFRSARTPTAEREPFTAPTARQVAALFAAAHDVDVQFELYLRLAAATGARRSELIALRWRHVQLDEGQVEIRDSLVYAPALGEDRRRGRRRTDPMGTGVSARQTKTGSKGRRVVPLDQALLVRLDEHRRSRESHQGVDRFVFSGDDGVTPWLSGFVQRRFEKTRAAAGLPDIRLHQLRHFHATQLLVGAVPPPVIAARLGHSNAATTLRVYGHAALDASRAAAEQFAASLARAERGDAPDSTTLVYREVALEDETRVLQGDVDRLVASRIEDDDDRAAELDEPLAGARRQLDAKLAELHETRVLLDEVRRREHEVEGPFE